MSFSALNRGPARDEHAALAAAHGLPDGADLPWEEASRAGGVQDSTDARVVYPRASVPAIGTHAFVGDRLTSPRPTADVDRGSARQ